MLRMISILWANVKVHLMNLNRSGKGLTNCATWHRKYRSSTYLQNEDDETNWKKTASGTVRAPLHFRFRPTDTSLAFLVPAAVRRIHVIYSGVEKLLKPSGSVSCW